MDKARWYVAQDANGNFYKILAYDAADAMVQYRLRVSWVIKMIRPVYNGLEAFEEDMKLTDINDLTVR